MVFRFRYSVGHLTFQVLTFFPFVLTSSLPASRLTESQLQQSEQSEGLQLRMNELKSSLSSAHLEVSRWMSQYDTLMEQHQGLDINKTKLENHCEVNEASSFTMRQKETNGKYFLFPVFWASYFHSYYITYYLLLSFQSNGLL